MGRVAEYCPICQTPRAFQVLRLKKITRVNSVAIRSGITTGFAMTCETCRCPLPPELSRYESIDEKPAQGLDELIMQTNPGLFEKTVARLERLERAERGELSSSDRKEAIFESLQALNPVVEARAARIHLDRLIIAVCFGSGLFCLAAVFVTSRLLELEGAAVPAIVLCLMLAGVACTRWAIRTEPKRYMRSRFRRYLGINLTRFRPSLEDLQEVLADLRKRGYIVGNLVNARWLYDAMAIEPRVPRR